MIRANELMAGDYLRVNRAGLCIKKGTIVEVRGIDADRRFDNHTGCASCHPLDDNQFGGGIWCDYLDPIPLTPEILEKNFPTAGELAWWPVEDGLHCESRNTDDIMVSGVFRFVHQLQNALRLCGIEKSIEL